MHYSSYNRLSDKYIIFDFFVAMERYLEVLLKVKATDQRLSDALGVISLLSHFESSIELENQDFRIKIIKDVLRRDSLDLLLNAINFLQPLMGIESGKQKSPQVLEKLLESFTYLPHRLAGQPSFIASLKSIDTFDFDLRYATTEQKLVHPGFSVKEIRGDKRKAHEIAEEISGKKADSKLDSIEFEAYSNAFIHVLLARSSIDGEKALKMQYAALRSLRYRTVVDNRCKVLNDKKFLQEAIEYLQEVESPLIAMEIIQILTLRLLIDPRNDQERDLTFYLLQLEQNNKAVTASNLLPEQCTIYKIYKQIKTVDLRKLNQQNAERSAFDEQQPADQLEQFVSDGFLKPTVANNSQVQQKVSHLCRVFKYQVLNQEFGQAQQIHRQAIHKILFDLDFASIMPEKCQNQTINQVFCSVNQFSARAIFFVFDTNNSNYLNEFENVVRAWIDSFDQKVFVFDQALGFQREITRLEKGKVVAELLNSLSNDKISQQSLGSILPLKNFGTRVFETQLLNILEEAILPKYEAQTESDKALDLVITAYVNLINAVITNEPSLVSQLLKGVEEQPAIINKLLAAFAKSSPKTQTYHYIHSDVFEIVCYNMFALLKDTENGRKAVAQNAKVIVEQLLTAKIGLHDATYFMGQQKQGRGILILSQKHERVLQIQSVATSICNFYKLHLLSLRNQLRLIDEGIKNLEDSNRDKSSKVFNFEFLTSAYFYDQKQELCKVEELLILLQVYKRNDKNGYSYGTMILTDLLKEKGSPKCTLEQLEGIFDCVESLLNYSKGYENWSNVLTNLIACLLEESVNSPQFDQKEGILLLGFTKNIYTEFLNLLDSNEVQTIEQLSALPNYKKLLGPVLILNNFVFGVKHQGRNFQFSPGKYQDWTDQIPKITKLTAMLISNQSELLDQAIQNKITAPNFKVSDSIMKKLQDVKVTNYIASYVPWVKQQAEVLEKVQKYQYKQYELCTRTDSFPFQFLALVKQTAFTSNYHWRHGYVQANSTQDSTIENSNAVTDQLVQLAHQLKTEKCENFDAQISHNSNIIQNFLSLLGGLNDTIPVALHIQFISKSGIVPLFKMFQQLKVWQEQIFQTQSDDQTIILKRSKILVQNEVVCKLLANLLRNPKQIQLIYDIDIKKITKNKFKSFNHLFMHQFNQAFEEILCWHDPQKFECGLSQLLRLKPQNHDQVLETLIQAFANQAWSGLDRDERRQGYLQQPRREVTEQELQQVTSMGFDQDMSGHAIRMANFDTMRAIDILLSRQMDLLQYIAAEEDRIKQENERKQAEELEREIEKTSLKQQEDKIVISIEEFEKRYKGFKDPLTYALIGLEEHKSQISSAKVLSILNVLRQAPGSTFFQGAKLVAVVNKSLFDQEKMQTNKSLQLQILLMVMAGQIKESNLPTISQIIQLGIGMIQNLEKNPQDQAALYYICLYLFQRTIVDEIAKQDTYDFLSLVFDSKVDQLVKEVASMTIYNCVSKLKQVETQKVVLTFINNFDLKSVTDSAIYAQLVKWSLYSEKAMEEVATNHIVDCFLSTFAYQNYLLRKRNKQAKIPKISDIAKIDYKNVLSDLLMISQDPDLIKRVLLRVCKVVCLKAEGGLICQPIEEIINKFSSKQKQGWVKIFEIRQNKSYDAQSFEVSSQKLLSQLDQDLRQNFSNHLNGFFKSIDYDNQQISIKALREFANIAQFSQVNPRLLPLIIQSIPENISFEEWFITKLCASCLVKEYLLLNPKQLPEFGVPVTFPEILTKVLGPLLGINSLTSNADEFTLKRCLMNRLISQAVKCIDLEQNFQTIKNKTTVYASLQVIRTLIAFNNQYEFNRVLRSKNNFYHCLDQLVIQTNFIPLIEKIFFQKMPNHDNKDQDVQMLYESAIECLLVVIEYINLKKNKLKVRNKNAKKMSKDTSEQVRKVENVVQIDATFEPVVGLPSQQLEAARVQEDIKEDNDCDANIRQDNQQEPDEFYDEEDDEFLDITVQDPTRQNNQGTRQDILLAGVVNYQPLIEAPNRVNYNSTMHRNMNINRYRPESWAESESHVNLLLQYLNTNRHQYYPSNVWEDSKEANGLDYSNVPSLGQLPSFEILKRQKENKQNKFNSKFETLQHESLTKVIIMQALNKNFEKFERQHETGVQAKLLSFYRWGNKFQRLIPPEYEKLMILIGELSQVNVQNLQSVLQRAQNRYMNLTTLLSGNMQLLQDDGNYVDQSTSNLKELLGGRFEYRADYRSSLFGITQNLYQPRPNAYQYNQQGISGHNQDMAEVVLKDLIKDGLVENIISQSLFGPIPLNQLSVFKVEVPLFSQAQQVNHFQNQIAIQNANLQSSQQEILEARGDQILAQEQLHNVNQVVQIEAQEAQTFGYPNSVLLAHDIDPGTLHEIPEDIRVQLLSMIQWQPSQNQVQAADQANQQIAPILANVAEPVFQGEAERDDRESNQELLVNGSERLEQENLQNQNQDSNNILQPDQQIQPLISQDALATDQDPNLSNQIQPGLNPNQLAQTQPALQTESELDGSSQDALRNQPGLFEQPNQNLSLQRRSLVSQQPQRLFSNNPPTGLFGQFFGQQPQRIPYFNGTQDQRQGGLIFGGQPQGGGLLGPPTPISSRSPDMNPYPVCYYCGGRGHKASNCQIQNSNVRSEQNLSPNEVIFQLTQNAGETIDEKNLRQIEDAVAESRTFVHSLYLLLLRLGKDNSSDYQRNTITHSFKLVPLLNALITIRTSGKTLSNLQVALELLQSGLLKLFGEIGNDFKPSKTFMNQIVLQICILRLIVRNNSKCGVRLIRKFLLDPQVEEGHIETVNSLFVVKMILRLLKSLYELDQEKFAVQDKTTISALQKNLQQTLTDILNLFDKVFMNKQGKSLVIKEETIASITSALYSSSSGDQQLVLSVGQALLTMSKVKEENWNLVFKVCMSKISRLQNQIARNLVRLLPDAHQFENENIPILSKALSLQKSISHFQSIQEKEEELLPKLAVTKSAIQRMDEMDTQLKKYQTEIACLVPLFEILAIFRKSADKTTYMEKDLSKRQVSEEGKSHLNALNELLKQIQKDAKNLKDTELLYSLKEHVNIIFDAYLAELVQVYQQKPKQQQQFSELRIKMRPINQVTSEMIKNQEKVASFMYGDSELSSPTLFEFAKFCLNNKEIINQMITNNQDCQDLSLNALTLVKYMPNVLNLENKKIYFRKELQQKAHNRIPQGYLFQNDYDPDYSQGYGYDSFGLGLSINVKRSEIFPQTFTQLGNKSANELLGRLNVNFDGERGQDAGGLTRDFYIELSRAMFNPSFSLFNLTSNGVTYYPNPQSFVNPDHLKHFKFIGQMIGKALFEGHLLECYFSKPLYKMMVGQDITFEDQQDLDNDHYRSCKWGLSNNIDVLELFFTVTTDNNSGQIKEKELIPGGQEIKVTDENKVEYFEKIGYYRMYESIKEQVDSLLQGFHEIIPKNLVKIFSPSELELLICGLPNFDLNDLIANTEYTDGYTAQSPQVLWLWKTLETATKEDIGRFLQFVTGCSRIPMEGFKNLQGMGGPRKFQITRIRDETRLPQGHTCFNQFDLPEYPTFEVLNEKVLYAIKYTVGFGFA